MSDYKSKLQEGTLTILNNLSEEYKNLLIEKALINNNLRRVEDILPEDLININEDFRSSVNVNNFKTKRERSISLIKLVGLMYGAFGFWLYIYTNLNIENSYQKISFILIGLGLFAYFLASSLDVLSIRKKQSFKFEKKVNEYKLVEKWNEIESLSYSIINIEENNSINIPISKVINLLYKEGMLDIKDVENYKDVLVLRNNIVHTTEKRINQEQINEGLEKAESIITKLKTINSVIN